MLSLPKWMFKGRNAIINGVARLNGANVSAQDLRGGSALILAALNAEGQSEISNIHHIERGYLDIDKKLSALGADIKKG